MNRIKELIAQVLALALVVTLLAAVPVAAQQPAPARVIGPTDRTILPILDPQIPTITEADARLATAPPRFEVKAPDGAPNVLIILIDDMGFGMSDSFGGPIHMPTAARLANKCLTNRLNIGNNRGGCNF